MSRIKVAIVGGAGYTGGELIRILLNHPAVDLRLIHSTSNAGKLIGEIHSDLLDETDLRFMALEPGIGPDGWMGAELLFLCVGHSESRSFLEQHSAQLPDQIRIIDLSQDFRLSHQHQVGPQFQGHPFIYGLPELNKPQISQAIHIANPGCFATAIQLGLLPLAKAGLLSEVYSTGITGSTGAGQSLSRTSHFSWRANNIQAYKTLTHQHLYEIHQSLHQLQASFPVSPTSNLHFVPWRGDFTRGIFISSQITCSLDTQALENLYLEYYRDHPFTVLSPHPISLKQVINTNKCVLQIEKVGEDRLVVHSALDNLLKGASGQAVQNMNLMYGLEETLGLKLKASYF
jgi:N-acetyl-gamma-glutamyl-phosphate reductase